MSLFKYFEGDQSTKVLGQTRYPTPYRSPALPALCRIRLRATASQPR